MMLCRVDSSPGRPGSCWGYLSRRQVFTGLLDDECPLFLGVEIAILERTLLPGRSFPEFPVKKQGMLSGLYDTVRAPILPGD